MEIGTYQVRYYGKQEQGEYWRAAIILTDTNGQSIGGIYFHDNIDSLPWHDGPIGSLTYMFLHPSRLPDILDLLRNEKPLYFTYDDRFNKTELSTSAEPVGEGELQP